MALRVTLNGKARTFELGGEPTLSALVGELGLKADRIALERNGEIVSRSQWESTSLADGDTLEMVHFVGGGCSAGCAASGAMAPASLAG